MGEKKHIIFFRQCLPLLASSWTATQKANLVLVLYELHFSLHINNFFSFVSRRRRWHGRTEGLHQSNDLIAGKKERQAKTVILLYDIYLVVKKKHRLFPALKAQTEGRDLSLFFLIIYYYNKCGIYILGNWYFCTHQLSFKDFLSH